MRKIKVWYYQVDNSKIKRGAKAGRWIRAKVIRASPRSSMVVIDLGTRTLQVNQSLLRRDADIFSEVEIPMVDPAAPTVPPPVPASSSSGRAPALLSRWSPRYYESDERHIGQVYATGAANWGQVGRSRWCSLGRCSPSLAQRLPWRSWSSLL